MAGMLSLIDLGLLCVSGLGVTVRRRRPCLFEGPDGVAIAIDEHCYDLDRGLETCWMLVMELRLRTVSLRWCIASNPVLTTQSCFLNTLCCHERKERGQHIKGGSTFAPLAIQVYHWLRVSELHLDPGFSFLPSCT
jgi:hypothetical protein